MGVMSRLNELRSSGRLPAALGTFGRPWLREAPDKPRAAEPPRDDRAPEPTRKPLPTQRSLFD